MEAAVLRALQPKHVLFLCVANSARSQMAEGLARAVAPDGVKVSSAGSEPTTIRPQAVAVLREVGIDAGRQHSKGMRDVEGEVDAVITLCAEEVCPAWLGKAWRVHWGLPDPAAVEGAEEEKMAAFRAVRDELRLRMEKLFGE
jgi:arsenate reductase